MTFYKLYDRNTLDLVDSGLVRDYSIDFDYMTNNNSTASLVRESRGFKGDIIAILQNAQLIALGAVTAIDNTDLKISFKHMKEIFNDSVLNVFLFTSLLNKRFDGVSGLKVILETACINTADPKKRLPLEIRTFGQDLNAVWTDDSASIDLLAFIDFLFDHYNIYLDFELDFANNKIICTIIKNTTTGLVIKDNIKLSKPEVDNNELPKENKTILYNKSSGATVATFYLLADDTLTTNANHANRVLPPATKYIEWDSVDAIKEGYTQEQLARSELGGNIFNHCIKIALAKKQTMVRAKSFKYGDKVSIIYDGRQYDSIFTGIKCKMRDPFYTCIFGRTRIDFTDRMKLYNARKFERRN